MGTAPSSLPESREKGKQIAVSRSDNEQSKVSQQATKPQLVTEAME